MLDEYSRLSGSASTASSVMYLRMDFGLLSHMALQNCVCASMASSLLRENIEPGPGILIVVVAQGW